MAVQATTSTTAATTTATTLKSKNLMDKNAFLKLLISQLKYQDPLDPMKADQFMSQLAQMTQVEQLQNISDSLDSMNKAATIGNPTQWLSAIGKKISVDSTLLSKGDQVYLTPSSDYDAVTLTLTKTDGSSTQQTFKKGDSLAYTHDGSDAVSYAVTATKNRQAVGCTASVYQIVRGIQVDASGVTTLVAGTGQGYTTDKVKQIIQ